MKDLKQIGERYLETLAKRSKESRVYKPNQMTGLMLAELFKDPAHKGIYMRLAKVYDNEDLLRLAKNVAERKNIYNKGAYFMKVLQAADIKRIDNQNLSQ